MDLVGPQGSQQFNLFAWKMLIDLAVRNGWQPAGAIMPDRTDWPEDELEDAEEDVEGDEEEDEEEPEEEDEMEMREIPAEEAERAALSPDNPVLQAILSFFPASGDRVLSSYFSNDGQRVTDEDARALADALERGLPDIPDHDALGHKTIEIPQQPGQRFIPLGTPVSPEEGFSGRHKARLKEFIAFCRQGGFEIW